MNDALSMFRPEGQSSGTADVPLRQDHDTWPPTLSGILTWIGKLNFLAGWVVGCWLIITGISEAEPMRIGLGAGLLVEGVIGGALFLGFASVVENLIVIRRRLES